MKKGSGKKKTSKKKRNKTKIYSLSELVNSVARLQQSQKTMLLHINEEDMPSAENILKDSSIKYSRIKMKGKLYRLELFPSQELRQSLDDIVKDFMSQFEEM